MGYIEVLLRYCEKGKWGKFSSEVVKMADAVLVELKKEKDEIFKTLEKMKCNRKYCDLRLSCGSEGEVWGSSMWLTTRCPALKVMIFNGVSDFPGTSVEGLHLVLEYLYLGTPRGYLQRFEPGLQRSVIYDALRIAGKLELDQLQEMMFKWLKALKNGQELVVDKADEDKAKEALLQDLSNMLNNPAYDDLDLLFSQGRDYKFVNELWLKARLDEFEEEFSSSEEMVSKLWTIMFDTDSEVVAVVLEYLYRGSSKRYLQGKDARARWDFGLGVVSLSLSLRLLRFVDIMLDIMMIEIVICEGDIKDNVDRLSGIRELEREGDLPERSRQKVGTLSDELSFRIERDWLSGDFFGALVGGDWRRKLDGLNETFMLNNPAYANLLRDSTGREAEFIRERGLKARLAELEEGFDSSREKDSKPRININITDQLVVLIVFQYLSRGSSEASVEGSDARGRWDFFLDVVALSLSLRLKQCLKSVWDTMTKEAMICSGNIEDNIYRLSRLRELQTEWKRKRYLPKHSRQVIKSLSEHVVCHIQRDWFNGDHVKDLSREDFLYFLRETSKERRKQSCVIHGPFRIEEYLRLRSIIRWCVWEQSQDAKIIISFVSWLFPEAEFTEPLHRIDCSEKDRDRSYQLLDRKTNEIVLYGDRLCGLKRVCQMSKFETTFLEFVDLKLIHPLILTKIVKPWDLIDSSLLARILEKQASGGNRRRQSWPDVI